MSVTLSRRDALRVSLLGQVILVAALALCVALHPGLVLKRDESGLSNYGVHLRTALAYSVAFLGAGLSAGIVALRCHELPINDRVLLFIYGVMMVAVMLSTYPYMVNRVWHDVHVGWGVALVTFEFATSWWWSLTSRMSLRWLWVGVQSGGTLLALLTFMNQVHLLFIAQVATSVLWGVIMVAHQIGARTAPQLIRDAAPTQR
jgi:hypothetical protein